MATTQTPKSADMPAAPKAKRAPTSMVDRMKAQLSAAACQSYLTLTRSSLTTVIIFDQAGGSVSGLVEN